MSLMFVTLAVGLGTDIYPLRRARHPELRLARAFLTFPFRLLTSYYSWRSAIIGSTEAARRAGM